MLKKLILILVIILSFALTGCMKSEVISDRNNAVLAENIAAMILKYDIDYEEKLIDPQANLDANEDATIINVISDNKDTSPINNKDTSSIDNKNVDNEDALSDSSNDTTDNTTEQFKKLSEVIGEKDFNIEFEQYKLVQNYPGMTVDSYFTIEARNNMKLLIIQFDIKNITSKKKNINLIDSNITYLLDINADSMYEPLMTLLVNDIQFIDIDIKGGEKEKGYLVFEVSQDIKLDKVNLLVSRDALKTYIALD